MTNVLLVDSGQSGGSDQPLNRKRSASGSPPTRGSSPDDDQSNRPKSKHKRVYHACNACRKRKTKCDVGDVDNPTDGKCAKCKRENRPCIFTEQRKKEKRGNREGSSDSGLSRHNNNNNTNNNWPPDASHSYDQRSFANLPPVLSHHPSLSVNSHMSPSINITPLPRQQPYSPAQNGYGRSPTIQFPTLTQSTPIDLFPPQTGQSYHTPTLRAAQPQNTVPFAPNVQRVPRSGLKMETEDQMVATGAGAQGFTSTFTNTGDSLSVLCNAAVLTVDANPDRARRLTMGASEVDIEKLPPDVAETHRIGLKIWGKVQYVKAGWMTASEALQYVDFFYTKMAPMSPILTQEFRDPRTHQRLVEEEPVLTTAILAIASRYMKLKGTAHESRGYYIHEKMWEALKKIVQRLIWGQEQFGGGFCNAGSAPTQESAGGQITWKGSLRTLGTIEALLLFTDWQPRALHFPPSMSDNKLISSDEVEYGQTESQAPPFATFLEPSWRSDRMSWMLLGAAQSLAFELGVFSMKHKGCHHAQDQVLHTHDCLNRRRIRRLLITYVSQISGRIGIQSFLSPVQDYDKDFGPDPTSNLEIMRKLWFEISHVMFDANRQIFPSKEYTTNLVSSGLYTSSIDALAPRLQDWIASYQHIEHKLNPYMKYVLRMEYEYARLYINSLGLQKIVETMVAQNPGTTGGPSRALAPVIAYNKLYLDEVRDASRQILHAACHGLGKLEALGHAPIRTFLRTLSGMMFMLKIFALGGPSNVIKADFRLLGETNNCLEKQIVDDVHLSRPISGLITHLMTNVKDSMIRIANKHGSSSQAQSRQPTPPAYGNGYHGGMPTSMQVPEQESPDFMSSIQPVDINSYTFAAPPDFNPDAMLDPNIFNDLDASLFGLPNNEDYIAMPLNNIFGVDPTQASVNQGYGSIGPTIGNRDMTDFLVNPDAFNHGYHTQHGDQMQQDGYQYGNNQANGI